MWCLDIPESGHLMQFDMEPRNKWFEEETIGYTILEIKSESESTVGTYRWELYQFLTEKSSSPPLSLHVIL